jgi:hypothetical protein
MKLGYFLSLTVNASLVFVFIIYFSWILSIFHFNHIEEPPFLFFGFFLVLYILRTWQYVKYKIVV